MVHFLSHDELPHFLVVMRQRYLSASNTFSLRHQVISTNMLITPISSFCTFIFHFGYPRKRLEAAITARHRGLRQHGGSLQSPNSRNSHPQKSFAAQTLCSPQHVVPLCFQLLPSVLLEAFVNLEWQETTAFSTFPAILGYSQSILARCLATNAASYHFASANEMVPFVLRSLSDEPFVAAMGCRRL
jgi:hypothetical protein